MVYVLANRNHSTESTAIANNYRSKTRFTMAGQAIVSRGRIYRFVPSSRNGTSYESFAENKREEKEKEKKKKKKENRFERK